ncbi:MAG: hypothetical protein CVV12_09950 [Gammaproteobacteria bacterium HGW-Gammaproteobacteria-2]|nr:MAG: hypothetical protein CVV12_09950 [Gammaproteobacteria bacterium HGW-Gammaproteobacteria-2]
MTFPHQSIERGSGVLEMVYAGLTDASIAFSKRMVSLALLTSWREHCFRGTCTHGQAEFDYDG